VRPLRRRYGGRIRVAPLTTVVDPLRLARVLRSADRGERESDLAYLYGRQLAEADLLALNKTDLIGAEQTAKLQARLAADYPQAVVVPYSATSGAGIDALVNTWRQSTAAVERDVEIDYTRYLDAEAQLAWLNQPVQVDASGEVFDALAWGRAVLWHLSDWSAATGLRLCHAKITVRTSAGLAKLSVTEAGAPPRIDRTAARPVTLGSAAVNARVVCPPAVLDAAVCAALAAADALSGTRSTAARPASFQPGHPRPRQRVTAAT
jgi:hypothetical protein